MKNRKADEQHQNLTIWQPYNRHAGNFKRCTHMAAENHKSVFFIIVIVIFVTIAGTMCACQIIQGSSGLYQKAHQDNTKSRGNTRFKSRKSSKPVW